MKIIVSDSYDQMSKKAADIVVEKVLHNPESVLGLATGSTPVGMYKCLIEIYQNGNVDFSKVHTVNLDEYIGLAKEHPQSFRYFMDKKFFDHVNIKKENIHMPDSMGENADKIAADYEKKIQEQDQIAVQILGIGNNGHVGFNEPAESFSKAVNIAELTEETISANA